jgi:hypothetical protein
MDNQIIYGAAEVCIDGELFSCDKFENITVEFSQDETEIESLCGIVDVHKKVPKVTVTATFLKSNVDILSKLFPEYANASAGSAYGNLLVGSQTCAGSSTGVELNIHNICDVDDSQDVHLFNAKPSLNFSLEYNIDDPRKAEVTWTGLPAPATSANAGLIFRIGTGDLTQDSVYDCATQATVPA